MSICLLDNPMNGAILAKAFSFPLAFSHTSEMWSSKFSLRSGLTPSNFSHLLFSSHTHQHEQLHFHYYLLVNDTCHDCFLKDYYQTIGIKRWKFLPMILIRSSILSVIICGVLSSA